MSIMRLNWGEMSTSPVPLVLDCGLVPSCDTGKSDSQEQATNQDLALEPDRVLHQELGTW